MARTGAIIVAGGSGIRCGGALPKQFALLGGMPVLARTINAVAAALILADKTDVRRTRVRNRDKATFDIHDRVNYAVEKASTTLDAAGKAVVLDLQLDTGMSPVIDYFEIFLERMLLCRKAAEKLGLSFRLVVNGQTVL